MTSFSRLCSSRSTRLFLFSLLCIVLPVAAVKFVEHKRKNSVLWENTGGFDDRAKAERASLQKLGQMIKVEKDVNLLWARYTLTIRDKAGKPLGFRLAAIGYNREKKSLIDMGADPNLKTQVMPPTQYDIYTPVSPADIVRLAEQQGRVDDVRKVVPNVRMRTKVVPFGQEYDETDLT